MKDQHRYAYAHTFQPLAVAAAAVVSKIEKKVTASPNAGNETPDFRQPPVQARSERVCPVRRRDAGRNPAQGKNENSLALPASEAKQSQQSPDRGMARQEDEGEGKDGRAGPPSCCGSLIAGPEIGAKVGFRDFAVGLGLDDDRAFGANLALTLQPTCDRRSRDAYLARQSGGREVVVSDVVFEFHGKQYCHTANTLSNPFAIWLW